MSTLETAARQSPALGGYRSDEVKGKLQNAIDSLCAGKDPSSVVGQAAVNKAVFELSEQPSGEVPTVTFEEPPPEAPASPGAPPPPQDGTPPPQTHTYTEPDYTEPQHTQTHTQPGY